MKKLMQYVFLLVAISFFGACGNIGSGILEETAGVWRAQGDATMVSIIYSDKKLSMLIGDNMIPVSLGDIDNDNKTINLNVTLNDGKPGIWTLKQIWDKDQKSFHLLFTLHDGTQDELSFVRKISTDDLNKLVNAVARNKPASINNAAVSATSIEAPSEEITASSPAPEAVAVPVSTPDDQVTFSPSFDCTKASTGAERLICSNQELAALDVDMMAAYKRLANNHPDKDALKREQNDWMKDQRNTCSTSDCMVIAYRSRIEDMESATQHLSKPAEFQ